MKLIRFIKECFSPYYRDITLLTLAILEVLIMLPFLIIAKSRLDETVVITKFESLYNPQQGICIYKGVSLNNSPVEVEATCCIYQPGDTVSIKNDKFFKILH